MAFITQNSTQTSVDEAMGCRTGHFVNWISACFLFLLTSIVWAADSRALLEQSRAVETDAMEILTEHYRFEEALLSPDNDRLTVFLTLPHGARVIMDSVTLVLDGKSVHTHHYTVDQLLLLRERNSQLLFATRIPPGRHSMRLDVKVMQGRVLPMKTFEFFKGNNSKFVELHLAGYDVREVFAVEW